MIVALIALAAALAGTATALPGKKTIDKNDFKNNDRDRVMETAERMSSTN